MENHERIPFLSFDQKGEAEVVLTLWAMGLRPLKDDSHDCKNGLADVTFNNDEYGMDAKIEVQETKTERTVWRLIVKKFPSKINRNKCHWRVDKDKIVITLFKKREKGQKEFIDWQPLFYKNGLDQYKEEEDLGKASMTLDLAKDGFPVTSITVLDIDRNKYKYSLVARKPP